MKSLLDALKERAVELVSELLGEQPNRRLSSKKEKRYGKNGGFALATSGSKAGLWIDHEAGHGGGLLDLIRDRKTGGSNANAAQWARRWLGWPEKDQELDDPFARLVAKGMARRARERADAKAIVDEALERAERAARIDRAKRIWDRAKPLSGTPGEVYFTVARQIPTPSTWPDQVVRFDPVEHAVVLQATDSLDYTIGVQIIRVTSDGRKIDPASGPLVKQSYGCFADGAVRLPGSPDGSLLLSEGPETGLTVWAATGHETWVTLGSVAKASPPTGRRVVVCRDDDKRDAPSQKALRWAARDWKEAGIDVVVATPWSPRREDKTDFNDLIRAAGPEAVRTRVEMVVKARAHTLPPLISIDDARRQLAEAVDGFFAAAAAWAPSGTEPPMHAIGVTLGGGKTEAALRGALRTLKRLRDQGDDGAVVIAVPEHRLSAEIANRFDEMTNDTGLQVSIWRGREAKQHPDKPELMCEEIETVRKAQSVMADVEKEVCAECPLLQSCAYLNQRNQSGDLWIVGHKMLFHAAPKAIAESGVAALVVDESPYAAGLIGASGHGIEIPLDSLDPGVMPIPPGGIFNNGPRLETIRQLLKKAVGNEPDGPIRKAVLPEEWVGFDTMSVARTAEWQRKVDSGPWGEREANRTLKSMVALWHAIEGLLKPGGPAVSGRLTLGRNRDGVRVLKVTGRADIADAWRVPTLLVDALLDEELARPYWPQITVTARLAVATPHMRIRQVAGRAFSKSMLEPLAADAETERAGEVQRTREKNRRKVRAFILKTDRERGGQTLVVGNKDIVDALALPPWIERAWFNAVAGRDQWGQVRTIIIIGRSQPRPQDVERMAGALTGAAPTTIAGWYPKADAFRLENCDGEIEEVMGECDQHPDVMAERIRSRVAEGEVMQALGRGRGVNRGPDNPLEVIVLGDSVLPVPVDGFLPDDAVLKPSPADLMLAEAGIAYENPTDAARAYPGLWATAKAAQHAFTPDPRWSPFPYDNTLIRKWGRPSQTLRLLLQFEYQRRGSGQRPASVWVDAAHVPDPRASVEARLGPLVRFEPVHEDEPPPTAPDADGWDTDRLLRRLWLYSPSVKRRLEPCRSSPVELGCVYPGLRQRR